MDMFPTGASKTRRRGLVPVAGSLATAVVALLFLVPTVLGLCLFPNEAAYGGSLTDGDGDDYIMYGWKGEVDLVAATPLNEWHAIIHPAQISSGTSIDFVGWGTVKGVGVEGTYCGNNYTSNWEVYVDGRAFGDYFCKQPYASVTNAAQDQFFRIEYATCPGDGDPKWVFYWNSAYKTCKTTNHSHGSVIAGGESVTPTQVNPVQNIAVDYSALRWKNGSGTWLVLPEIEIPPCEDGSYRVEYSWNASWSIEVDS